jgi:hypothetical protein
MIGKKMISRKKREDNPRGLLIRLSPEHSR